MVETTPPLPMPCSIRFLMGTLMPAVVLSVLLCETFILTGCTAASGSGLLTSSSNPIEARYAGNGPFATTTGSVTNGSVVYKLFYPQNYAALGFKSPIITWGNGSFGSTSMYTTLLSHLASYGFTVVAPELQNAGSGRDIGAAAHFMMAQNTTPGSPFRGNLDTKHIAAVGHSQGASGAANAALKNPQTITAVLTFSLPDARLDFANSDCATAADCTPKVSALKQPIFFVSTRGPFDTQFLGIGIASPTTEKAYYDSVKGHAAMGIITNSDGQVADHSSIQDANSATKGNPGGFLGYATAWLEYQLRNDTSAAGAFSGSKPEILNNTNWSGSAVK